MEHMLLSRALWPSDSKCVPPHAGDGFASVHVTRELPAGAVLGPCVLHNDFYDTVAFIALKARDNRNNCYAFRVDPQTMRSSPLALSWLRLVQAARNRAEQNMEAFLEAGQLFFRTITRVQEGEELLVWYDEELSRLLGLSDSRATPTSSGFCCVGCGQSFQHEHPYLAHCRFLCSQTKSDWLSSEPQTYKPISDWLSSEPQTYKPISDWLSSEPLKNKPICGWLNSDQRSHTHTDFHNIARELEQGGRSSPSPRKRHHDDVPDNSGRKQVLLEKPNPTNESNIPPPLGGDRESTTPPSSLGGDRESTTPPSSLGGDRESTTPPSSLGGDGESRPAAGPRPHQGTGGVSRRLTTPTGGVARKAVTPIGHSVQNRDSENPKNQTELEERILRTPERVLLGSVGVLQRNEEQRSAFCRPFRRRPATSEMHTQSRTDTQTHTTSSHTDTRTHTHTHTHSHTHTLSSAALYTPPAPSANLPLVFEPKPALGFRNVLGSALLYADAPGAQSSAHAVYPYTPPAPTTLPVLPPTLSPLGVSGQNRCAKCSLSFRMTSDLVLHMRSHHKRELASAAPLRSRREERLSCSVCLERFRERHHLSRHMTSHT